MQRSTLVVSNRLLYGGQLSDGALGLTSACTNTRHATHGTTNLLRYACMERCAKALSFGAISGYIPANFHNPILSITRQFVSFRPLLVAFAISDKVLEGLPVRNVVEPEPRGAFLCQVPSPAAEKPTECCHQVNFHRRPSLFM